MKDHLTHTLEMLSLWFLFLSLHSHPPGFLLNLSFLSLFRSLASLTLDCFNSSPGKLWPRRSLCFMNISPWWMLAFTCWKKNPELVKFISTVFTGHPIGPREAIIITWSFSFASSISTLLCPWFDPLYPLTLSISRSTHCFYYRPQSKHNSQVLRRLSKTLSTLGCDAGVFMEPTGSLISSRHKLNQGNRVTRTSIILSFYL